MNWLDRAENKFGHLAIPGLPRIIAGLNLLVFVLYKLEPNYLGFLHLDPAAVMQGQVWRLFTFLLIPSFGGFFADWFSVILYLLYIVFIGTGLEQAMGSFRFNVYYALGALGVIVSSFFFGGWYGNSMLNTTLLFAFAHYYPDTVIYIMFILPAKVKWLAWATAALLVFSFVTSNWGLRMSMLAAFLNYWIFFGADLIRAVRDRREIAERRSRFQGQVEETAGPLHQCIVCKRTDVTAPDLDFRVARDGEEYCREHLPKR
jgi:hypothetical protein